MPLSPNQVPSGQYTKPKNLSIGSLGSSYSCTDPKLSRGRMTNDEFCLLCLQTCEPAKSTQWNLFTAEKPTCAPIVTTVLCSVRACASIHQVAPCRSKRHRQMGLLCCGNGFLFSTLGGACVRVRSTGQEHLEGATE